MPDTSEPELSRRVGALEDKYRSLRGDNGIEVRNGIISLRKPATSEAGRVGAATGELVRFDVFEDGSLVQYDIPAVLV